MIDTDGNLDALTEIMTSVKEIFLAVHWTQPHWLSFSFESRLCMGKKNLEMRMISLTLNPSHTSQ